MFEHVRYWQALFQKISVWLEPDGLFFMQIFAHKHTPYFFEEDGQSAAWMSSDYLARGLMPSLQLPLMFGDDLVAEQHWQIPGEYYQKTANAWLQKMSQNKNSVWADIERSRGKKEVRALWIRWRLFYMSNAELFGFNGGDEWLVGQYLFCRPD
jgi:cyclopropane-fatty-acyl-phospholipid synthase